MKIGGIINMGVGIGVTVFLYALLTVIRSLFAA